MEKTPYSTFVEIVMQDVRIRKILFKVSTKAKTETLWTLLQLDMERYSVMSEFMRTGVYLSVEVTQCRIIVHLSPHKGLR